MQVTLTLPEDVAQSFNAGGRGVERALLESAAIEGYRSGTLTHAQVGRLLGFKTPLEVEELLCKAGIFDDLDEAEFDRELAQGRELLRMRKAELAPG